MPDIAAARPVAGQPIETVWGQQMHDSIEAIQYGQVNVVLSAAGTATSAVVTFPRAYAAPPLVVATVQGASTMITSVNTVTATTVTVSLRHYDSTATTATLPVTWIAIGVLA